MNAINDRNAEEINRKGQQVINHKHNIYIINTNMKLKSQNLDNNEDVCNPVEC